MDPDGRTIVPANEEAANTYLDAGNRILGEERNPLYYNTESGQIHAREFNRSEYEEPELEYIDRGMRMLEDDVDVVIKVVGNDEVLTPRHHELNESNNTLRERGLAGATFPAYARDSETGEITKTALDIFISRSPERRTKIFDRIVIEEEPVWYKSLVMVHEVLGHGFLHVVNPSLDRPTHNDMVEDFETRMRGILKHAGIPVRGRAPEHSE